MKKFSLGIIMLFFCGINHLFAQNIDSLQSTQTPTKLAEIRKMVSLDDEQSLKLDLIFEKYANIMDSAIYKVQDTREASNIIYRAKKYFDISFMNVLSDIQKKEYVQNIATPEISRKTEGRMYYLKNSGEYSEAELDQFYDEIFNYLMLEKYVYVTEKYNHLKQKENIAQLKKLEPKCLKTANGLQKAKHQGRTYQNGYHW